MHHMVHFDATARNPLFHHPLSSAAGKRWNKSFQIA